MTLIFCDFLLFVGGALLFDDDDDDGASIASGLSLVELLFDVDDDGDDDFVTTAICCAGLKNNKIEIKYNFTIFLKLKNSFFCLSLCLNIHQRDALVNPHSQRNAILQRRGLDNVTVEI